MNGKKIITMTFKTLNFSNEIKKSSRNGGGRRQLIKSLRHSLRIPNTDHKKLEWIEEQSHRNLIWLPASGTVALDSIDKEQRERLLAEITDDAQRPTVNNTELTALKELRAKLKNTVNNACKKETNTLTIMAFQEILNVQGVADANYLINNLESFDFPRKKQKLETAKKFLDCHNSIQQFESPGVRKNQAVIQEVFFKFPAKNNVHGLLPQDRIEHIKGFYELLFLEYPIHFIVLHGDEDAEKTDASDHPHIFISTKNSRTGRYDLREKQISKVNSYLKQKYPNTKPISNKPDFLESQLLFGYLQEMFYAYTNNKLLKSTEYLAKKLKSTQEHMAKLRQIKSESYKPKSERSFNLYEAAKVSQAKAEHGAELAETQRQEAFHKAQKAKAFTDHQIRTAKEAITQQRQAERATSEEREQATAYQRKAENFKHTIANKNVEFAKIQSEIEQKTKELNLFKVNLGELIDGIVGWLEELFKDKRKSVQDLYLEKSRQAYARIEQNDKTYNKIFKNQADHEIDLHLDILDNHGHLIPDLPKSSDIKRKIKPSQ